LPVNFNIFLAFQHVTFEGLKCLLCRLVYCYPIHFTCSFW